MKRYESIVLSLALVLASAVPTAIAQGQSQSGLVLASYNATLNIPNQTFSHNVSTLDMSYFTSRYTVTIQYHVGATGASAGGLTALNSSVDPSVLQKYHIIAVFYPDYGYSPFGGNLIISTFSDVKSGTYNIPLKAVGADPSVATLVLTVHNPSNSSAPNAQILFNTTGAQGAPASAIQQSAAQQGTVSASYLYAAIIAIIVLGGIVAYLLFRTH